MIKELLTKSQAKERGLARYYTGLLCSEGHQAERRVCNGKCVVCERLWVRRAQKTPEYKARKSIYDAKRREQKRNYLAEKQKEWRNKPENKAHKLAYDWARRSGEKVPRKEVKRFIAESMDQKPHSCQLCGKEAKMVFDHDHHTGRFRGFICNMCNRVLGCVDDNTSTLLNMVRYLNAHKQESA